MGGAARDDWRVVLTAERAPAQRVVTVERARWNWREGYFDVLVGLRIAFLQDDGSPASGILEAVRETAGRIELTMSVIGPED